MVAHFNQSYPVGDAGNLMMEGVRAVGALNVWDTTAHVPPDFAAN
jgi:hypothetical protein